MVAVSGNELASLEATLLNVPGNVPLHKRFRALFTLKALKNADAIRIISKGEPRGRAENLREKAC